MDRSDMAASPFIRLIIMKQISAYSAQLGQLGAHRFNTPLKRKRFLSTRRFKKRAQLCETPGKGVGCCAVFLGPQMCIRDRVRSIRIKIREYLLFGILGVVIDFICIKAALFITNSTLIDYQGASSINSFSLSIDNIMKSATMSVQDVYKRQA